MIKKVGEDAGTDFSPWDLKDKINELVDAVNKLSGEAVFICYKCGDPYDVVITHDRYSLPIEPIYLCKSCYENKYLKGEL